MAEVNPLKPQTMPFWDFPDELIEQILAEIELHRDLIAFACTSRLCSQLIIPRHTEYRLVVIGETGYEHTWAHLASRPDLAGNIREIYIQDSTPDFPRVPTLETKSQDFNVDYKEGHTDVLTAIRHMTRLTLFSWECLGLSNFATPLFEVLERLGSVQHLDLQIRKRFSPGEPVERWKLWNMTQLRSIRLERDLWFSTWLFDLEPPRFIPWLSSLTSLEHLCVPYQVIAAHGAELFFPNLKTFLIDTVQMPSITISAIMAFLERHRSLEGLNWSSEEQYDITPTPGFLPNLKQLTCSWHIFERFQISAAGTPARCIEELSLFNSGEINVVTKLCESSYLNRSALQCLRVPSSCKTDDLKRLTSLYPGIEELSVPWKLVTSDDGALWLEGLLDCFEQFKCLQVIRHGFLWSDIVPDRPPIILDDEIQALVDERTQILARRCPNLREICHPKGWSHTFRIERGSDGEVRTRDLQQQVWNPFEWFENDY